MRFPDTWATSAPLAAPSRATVYLLGASAAGIVSAAALWTVTRKTRSRPAGTEAPVLADPSRITSTQQLAALAAGGVGADAVLEVSLQGAGDLTSEVLLQLHALPSLKLLDLGGCGLTSLPNGFFAGLSEHLEVLNLAENRLEALPADIGALANLVRLGLKGNRLTALPDSIGSLTALKELYLTDNRLAHLPRSIGALTALVKLQASFNRLTDLPDELERCERLELLRVACCRIERLPASLARLPALSWFSIAGNPVADALSLAAEPRRRRVPLVALKALALGPKLGCGASGDVWRAQWDGRDVAVKIFEGEVSPDGRAADEEAVALALADPGLVRVLARLEAPRGLVLGLVEGRPLAEKPNHASLLRCRWDPGARLALGPTLRAARDVAAALAYLHSQGIAHGDVYAHTVLATPDGRAVLCDYGEEV